ncbi:P-loop containing nucleoside triphosphate hydrolase protein [Mycena olivaceomarginata]|nr:P-loop containing nucleoside triphosphate hydrolase protein [Mycena olivaceomarginata]
MYQRWDKNGDEYYIRQKKADIRTPGSDWWQKHVLSVIRHFDEFDSETVEQTKVEVYSKHLRNTLAKVIGTYPLVSFHTEHVSLVLPAEYLYHYLSELRAEAGTLQEGSVELEHLTFLLDFIETQFANTIESVNNLRPRNLPWTLYRPGTIIHSKIRGYNRAFKLESYHTASFGMDVGFHAIGNYIDYDGKNFGKRTQELKIPPFAGSRTISTLPFAPLEMRMREAEIREELMKRGERFQSMRGQCHGEYVGVAIEQRPDLDKKFSIKSRVMIDGTSYNRICRDYSWEAAPEVKTSEDKTAEELTDKELPLATNALRGFSFSEKKWFQFIDNYSEIVWNEVSFERLVLPEASKTLIRALVSSHLKVEDSKFDDIIQGEGRGLVTVLHGSPGVGKTLTAECIAEYTRRPLYVVSSADLSTSVSNLERELARILGVAHTWKAVLLIDEAHIFLEKRTLTDVNRNALVSVFLRLSEYYEGILFPTTNRVSTFDPAFRSRIHMALKYENLQVEARRRLWKDFLSKLNGGAGADVSEEGYDALAQHDINGREIKNAVKTAESLATFTEEPLNLEHLETVLKTQADFAEAFVGSEF